MKKGILSLTAASCFLTVSAVSAAPFTSPHGYSVTPAPGWRISRSPETASDDVVIECTKSVLTDGKPNFRVDVKLLPPSSATLEMLAPAVVSGYKKRFPGLVFKSQTYSSVGGVRDLDIVFTHVKDGVPLRLRQVYVLKNSAAYVSTVAYPEKVHAKYDPAVAQMLSSVHWKS